MFLLTRNRMGLRRSKEETKVGILKSCVVEELWVSRLMALQNLPFKLLCEYLDALTSAGLVEITIERGKKLVHTTEKGFVALSCYRNAVALLEGRLGNCPLANRVIESEVVH